jgi:hypothetical protein
VAHADRMHSGAEPARAVACGAAASRSRHAGAALEDRRPEAVAQRHAAEAVQQSPRVAAQRQRLAQWSAGAAQRQTGNGATTALPEALRKGIESLSGLAMDGVRVHHDSAKPAELGALAHAQGNDIYLGPGQEQHLPHEAWHVVQQAQGRVRPTLQLKGGKAVNDDLALEQEADRMGERALRQADAQARGLPRARPGGLPGVAQRTTDDGKDYKNTEVLEAIEDVKKTVKKKSPSDTDYAKAMSTYLTTNCGKATKYKTPKALETQCKAWWNKPSDLVAVVVQAARTALVAPEIEYGAEHGDRHFIKTPTKKKAAWDLDKDVALPLMVTEIEKHLAALGKHSAANESRDGWTTFYVTGQHSGPVGRYWVKDERTYPTTDCFSMQVQVHYQSNTISYHGYPDEEMEGKAKGCSKTKMGDKLT